MRLETSNSETLFLPRSPRKPSAHSRMRDGGFDSGKKPSEVGPHEGIEMRAKAVSTAVPPPCARRCGELVPGSVSCHGRLLSGPEYSGECVTRCVTCGHIFLSCRLGFRSGFTRISRSSVRRKRARACDFALRMSAYTSSTGMEKLAGDPFEAVHLIRTASGAPRARRG